MSETVKRRQIDIQGCKLHLGSVLDEKEAKKFGDCIMGKVEEMVDRKLAKLGVETVTVK